MFKRSTARAVSLSVERIGKSLDRWVLGLVLALLTLMPPGHAGAATAAGQAREWNDLAEAARKEGKVVISAGRTATRLYGPIFEKFGQKHGIRVTMGGGSGSSEAERILSETRAGIHAVDLIMGGITNGQQLYDQGVLGPVKDWFVLPEVKDPSGWWQKKHWFGDRDRTAVFLFGGAVTGADIAVNTKVFDPKEITSYWDLLQPKYHGKIVMHDIDESGVLGSMLRYYVQPGLGKEWLRKLILETKPTMTTDKDMLLDWLITGVKGLSIFHGTIDPQIAEYSKKGAPVHYISRPLKEGGAFTSTGSSQILFVPKRPANPNAAKLMLNLWLSREGQTAMQRVLRDVVSVRDDIPTDMSRPDIVRKPGVAYVYVDGDPILAKQRPEAEEFVRQLAKEWRAQAKR
jgi:ABC-type Fe3+ transport system substrate-binding protein